MILALETGQELASVALLDGMEVAAERAFRHRMSLSQQLMPAIEALQREAHVQWAEIEAVAVDLGPGSYTGLRIGVVTAKSLGWASDRPVLGISSLAALAAAQLAPAEALVCPVLEARPGEYFTALYQQRAGDLQLRAGASVLQAAELGQRLSAYPGPVLVTGHTARFSLALGAVTPEPAADESAVERGAAEPGTSEAAAMVMAGFDEQPQARWIGRLAAARLRAGERDDPRALIPFYVRAPAPTVRQTS